MTHDELRALASAATPGPWETGDADPEGVIYVGARFQDEVYATADLNYASLADAKVVEDARYIAAANPATVLALLDEVARLRAVARAACEERTEEALIALWNEVER